MEVANRMDTTSLAELSSQYNSKSIGKPNERHSGFQTLFKYIKDTLRWISVKSGARRSNYSVATLFSVFHILTASKLCARHFHMGE